MLVIDERTPLAEDSFFVVKEWVDDFFCQVQAIQIQTSRVPLSSNALRVFFDAFARGLGDYRGLIWDPMLQVLPTSWGSVFVRPPGGSSHLRHRLRGGWTRWGKPQRQTLLQNAPKIFRIWNPKETTSFQTCPIIWPHVSDVSCFFLFLKLAKGLGIYTTDQDPMIKLKLVSSVWQVVFSNGKLQNEFVLKLPKDGRVIRIPCLNFWSADLDYIYVCMYEFININAKCQLEASLPGAQNHSPSANAVDRQDRIWHRPPGSFWSDVVKWLQLLEKRVMVIGFCVDDTNRSTTWFHQSINAKLRHCWDLFLSAIWTQLAMDDHAMKLLIQTHVGIHWSYWPLSII